ncbi:MAG: 3-hydroxyacyl-ACP dehydratase FabZ family protein [Marinicella sp.]
MNHQPLSFSDILALVPQQAPFRFIDEIIALNEDEIIGSYTFKEDESFYAGHFPGKPVTPGVILLETMAQTGVVAYGLYLLSLQLKREELDQWLTLFSDAEVEFSKPVYPGEKVTITAKKVFWRRMKLKASVQMHNAAGELVSNCVISGMGVPKQ